MNASSEGAVGLKGRGVCLPVGERARRPMAPSPLSIPRAQRRYALETGHFAAAVTLQAWTRFNTWLQSAAP